LTPRRRARRCHKEADTIWVREIDHRRVGRGESRPVTRRLQEALFSIVKGSDPGMITG
jgi:hypothetical protein